MTRCIHHIILLCLALFGSQIAFAYDFEVNGIYYHITSLQRKTVEVTYQNNSQTATSSYAGVVSIPDFVSYDNTDYSVTAIGDWAFCRCSSLTEVQLPSSIERIGSYAFFNCDKLLPFIIPDKVSFIGNRAFYGNPNFPTSSNLRYLDSYLVAAIDKNQNEYTIQEGTKWIGSMAFSGCSAMTNISIPSTVASIGNHAFQNCNNLSAITIPAEVQEIGFFAFEGCSNLKEITVHWTTPLAIEKGVFNGVNIEECVLHVPFGSKALFQESPEWGSFIISEAEDYDKGYAIQVLPFAFSGEKEVDINLDNATALTNIAFNVVLPSSFVTDELYSINPTLIDSQYTMADALNDDGSIHVTIDRSSSNVIDAGNSTRVATLGLVYNATVGSKLYPVTIKDIVLTAEDGTIYHAAPYTTEIYAGTNPKAELVDGVAVYHGNYGGPAEVALLKASLPTRATVDLTQVSALAEDLTSTPCDNVIITTEKVAYGRTVSNRWGSLCLPFAVQSNGDVQFYTMTGATEECLVFEPVETVAANTPSVFKATTSNFCLSAENDGSLAANFASAQSSLLQNQLAADWVMNGSYIDQNGLDVSAQQAYAISADAVHKVTETLNVKAFRAWFQNNGAVQSARLRITDGTNGIENIDDAIMPIEQLYFDLNGRQQQSRPEQHLFIDNGKVIFNK